MSSASFEVAAKDPARVAKKGQGQSCVDSFIQGALLVLQLVVSQARPFVRTI